MRFDIKESFLKKGEYMITDDLKKYVFPAFKDKDAPKSIVDCLNKQEKEIRELKCEIDDLKHFRDLYYHTIKKPKKYKFSVDNHAKGYEPYIPSNRDYLNCSDNIYADKTVPELIVIRERLFNDAMTATSTLEKYIFLNECKIINKIIWELKKRIK